MRILLPPSEGKTPPEAGPALDLAALSNPELNPIRQQLLAALTELCRVEPERAHTVLGLGVTGAADVQRNAELQTLPCAPAAAVYTGVLFGSLDLGSLPTADETVLIASGLFGLLRPTDPIPAYRLAGNRRLPGLPTPRGLWTEPLTAVLSPLAEQHLLLDLRSQTYAKLAPGAGPQWVPVRMVAIRDGRRVTLSHHNKASKGALARDLIRSGESPQTPAALVGLLGDLGWQPTLAGSVLEVSV